MKIQFFTKAHYDSFVCLAVDTRKTRYWYNLSTPLYLKWFPQYLVDDRLRTDEEKEAEKALEKSIGTQKVSLQPLIEGICHLLIHIKYTFRDIQHDKYWAKMDPQKYGSYDKWYTKLFSREYFDRHQYRTS